MKRNLLIFSLALLAGFSSCKKDSKTGGPDVNPVYDDPLWSAVEAKGDYAYTMTAVFDLPADLKANVSDGDRMAAFVGDECRAVSSPNNGLFILNIVGTSDEESALNFKYWNASTHYLYEFDGSVTYVPDLIYGVVDEPILFICNQL